MCARVCTHTHTSHIIQHMQTYRTKLWTGLLKQSKAMDTAAFCPIRFQHRCAQLQSTDSLDKGQAEGIEEVGQEMKIWPWPVDPLVRASNCAPKFCGSDIQSDNFRLKIEMK